LGDEKGKQEFQETSETGRDIVIPTEKYASKLAGTEHNEFLKSELKKDPDDLNGREARVVEAQVLAEEKKAIAESDKMVELEKKHAAKLKEEAKILENATVQLENAGYTKDTAAQLASVVSSGFKSLAKREGINFNKLFEQYNLVVTRPELLEDVRDDETVFSQKSKDTSSRLKDDGFTFETSGLSPIGKDGKVKYGSTPRGKRAKFKITVKNKDGVPAAEANFKVNKAGQLVIDKSQGKNAINIFKAFKDKSHQLVTELYRMASEQTGLSIALPFEEETKGRIRFFKDGQAKIELLKTADLSTFIHEMGHLYLEILGDLASRKDASQQIKDDYKVLLDWFGVESKEDVTTAHHEQFAEGFEKYIQTNKAPSQALKKAFAKFRGWLGFVYSGLKELKVELTPEVRQVMDRMLATEEEIQNVKNETKEFSTEQETFNDLIAAGMPEKEAPAFANAIFKGDETAKAQLFSKHLDEVTRERKKWWKAELSRTREEVAKELDKEPVYEAMANLQRGTNPDGSELLEPKIPLKLDRAALIKEFDADYVKKLPKPHVYAREGGVHHDTAAEAFGFKTGRKMVETINKATPRKAEIEKRAEALMKERHGDLLNDGRARKLAEEAVHNTDSAEVMRLSLKAMTTQSFAKLKGLAKRISKPIPTNEFYREQAESTISKKKIRDIRPAVYRNAETKAKTQALDLFYKGDFRGAFDAKLKQLLNHELYRASVKALENVDKSVNYVNRFKKKELRQRLGKAGKTYLEQIESILERYSFVKGISLKALDRKEKLKDFMIAQAEAGQPIDIPGKLLDEANREHYKELPLDTFNAIIDTIKNIEQVAINKEKLLDSKFAREQSEASEELLAAAMAHHNLTPKQFEHAPQSKAVLNEWRKQFLSYHEKLEFMFQFMDGNKFNGPWWRFMFKPFADAETNENTLTAKISDRITKAFSRYTKREKFFWYDGSGRVYIPEIDTYLTKPNMLMVALQQGNEYNKAALLDGEGWTQEQVDAILGHLDKRDFDVVQDILDTTGSLWPLAKQLEEDVNGFAPEKVEALPIETKYGTYPGGYFPIVPDPRRSDAAFKQAEAQRDLAKAGAYSSAMTKHGHLIERKHTGGKALSLDLSSVTGHLHKVIHDITHRRALIDVQNLLSRPEISNAIKAVAGEPMYRQLDPWLKDIAGEVKVNPTAGIERVLNKLRSNTTVVGMGWGLRTAMVQPGGYLMTVSEIGEKYAWLGLKMAAGYTNVKEVHVLAKGKSGLGRDVRHAAKKDNPALSWYAWLGSKMATSYKNVKEAHALAKGKSGLVRDRMDSFDRDVRHAAKKDNLVNAFPGKLGVASAYHQEVASSYFTVIGLADMAVVVPSWNGAYAKAMDGHIENIEPGDDLASIDYADSIIRITQGSGGVKDLAAIQRGNAFLKIYAMFYSFFSVQFNQFKKVFTQYSIDANRKDVIHTLFYIWFLSAIQDDLLLGRAPSTDDDAEDWLRWLGGKLAVFPTLGIVGLKDITGSLESGFEYGASPVIRGLEKLVETATIVKDVVLGDKEEFTKGNAKSAFMTTGYAVGLPSAQVWKTTEYFIEWLQGEIKPDTPVEGVWRALVIGKDYDQKKKKKKSSRGGRR